MSDFVSHGTIMCDNKDPTRFNNKIRTLIQEMNKKNSEKKINIKKLKARH